MILDSLSRGLGNLLLAATSVFALALVLASTAAEAMRLLGVAIEVASFALAFLGFSLLLSRLWLRFLGDGHFNFLACASVLAFTLVFASTTAESVLLFCVRSQVAALTGALNRLRAFRLVLFDLLALITMFAFSFVLASTTAETMLFLSVLKIVALFAFTLL